MKLDRYEYLTIEDVDYLPNGMATVVDVAHHDRSRQFRCRIDENGFLRTMNGEVVSRSYEVVDP